MEKVSESFIVYCSSSVVMFIATSIVLFDILSFAFDIISYLQVLVNTSDQIGVDNVRIL